MEELPKGEWYCDGCRAKGKFSSFAFGDAGKEYSLEEFGRMAAIFKRNHFAESLGRRRGRLALSTVEREFWRLVLDESPDAHVVVEYGADVHTSEHGSGFPLGEDGGAYAKSGWNLNNLPILRDSLLSHCHKSDISGMMVPWLYVGMVFTSFCWVRIAILQKKKKKKKKKADKKVVSSIF